MQKQSTLLEGPLLPALLKFTLPILITIMLQLTYATVDLLIIGQFATVADLSGVTIGSQIMHILTGFSIGLTMGTTILVGQYIGRKLEENVSRTIGVSIVIFSTFAFVLAFLLIVFNHEIIAMMQTPTESTQEARDYLFIGAIGMIFVVYYNLLASIFRGIGDSKTPLITVAIACVINIILDLIFIAVFDMGAKGAALATAIAQASSVALSLLIIKKQKFPYRLKRQDFSFNFSYSKQILKLGMPIALQNGLVGVSFLVVTAIINDFGVVASASVGIVERISAMIMIVPMAFGQSLAAFAAQNYGASQHDRGAKGLYYAMGISVVFGIITGYLGFFHGTIFTKLFTNDPETTKAALLYLQSYSFDTVLVAIMFSMNGYLNGCGKTSFVMIQTISSAFLIRIPLAYYFSHLENTSLFIIGLATPASTFLQVIGCILYFRAFQRNLHIGKRV